MSAYRCRFIAPYRSDWSTVEAESPELAANELHSRDERTYAITYIPDPSKPGGRVHFARMEVEGHGTHVSRVYTSAIVRRGGVRIRPVALSDVAKVVGWGGRSSRAACCWVDRRGGRGAMTAARCRHPARFRTVVDGVTHCRRCLATLQPARPGAGQPPVRGQAQRERLHLKLTEAEIAEIQAAAGAAPLGPWIIEAALRRARSGR